MAAHGDTPWWHRFGPRTLAGRFLVLQLVVVGLVLLVAGVVSVRQAMSQFSASSGDRVLGAAENLAGNPLLRELPTLLQPEQTLAPTVEAARIQSGASVVLVADADRTIAAASDPTLVGTTLTMPDEDAWDGRAWDGDLTLGGQRLIAASVPIYALDGSVLGLALVGESYPSTWSVLVSGVPELLLLIVLAAVAGLVGSWLLARRIKRQTHGLEPAEIAVLADHREALLHSIEEGVVGVSADGTVTVLNDAARRLLGVNGHAVGRKVDDLGLGPDLNDVLTGRRSGLDVVVANGDRVLVANRRTARKDGDGTALGAVTTLRDRSELLAVQRQLGATRSVTTALRAQTHEFDNQLHIISGLTQFGSMDEVRDYVSGLTRRRAEVGAALTSRIDDPPLAALLLAKSSRASETAVALEVSPESYCSRLDVELSTDVTTVVGNLVDNALDAVANSADATVLVTIESGPDVVRVEVRDSGPGVPADIGDRLFDRGFTTKPDAVVGGRGVGLSLVRRICEARGGSVRVQPGGPGATFVAELPVTTTAEPVPAGSAPVSGAERR